LPQDRNRSDDLSKDKELLSRLEKRYSEIHKGFIDQQNRAKEIDAYWNCYHCILDGNQTYFGDTEVYFPAIYDAIEARVTRFSNQLFPPTGQHVEAVSEDLSAVRSRTSLIEDYIRRSGLGRLSSQLIVNGDVEGHYWLYVEWNKESRVALRRIKRTVDIGFGPLGTVDDLLEEEIPEACPRVDILSDCDILILPPTARSPEDAIEQGGSATIIRRWTEPRIQQLIDEGFIDKSKGKKIIDELSKHPKTEAAFKDTEKKQAFAAGVHGGRLPHAIIWEVWSKEEVDYERRICRTFYGGDKDVLHCHRNPLWCDRIPLCSKPVRAIHGSCKGRSPISHGLDFLQYRINDLAMEAADSSLRGMIPIAAVDPIGLARWKDLVYAQGAIWPVHPDAVKFLEVPPIYMHAPPIIAEYVAQIMKTLGVNPAMITQGYKNKKLSQAEVAQEHAVDLLTTSIAVTTLEELYSEVLLLFDEFDYQYRDTTVTVRSYGDLGIKAIMEEIEPFQENKLVHYNWYGVAQIRATQQLQQGVAFFNVMKGIPPQMYQGYRMNMAPALVAWVNSIFGANLGRQIFEDVRSQLSMSPDIENELMDQGMTMPVHALDKHQEHMQSHLQFMQQTGDPSGTIRDHLIKHQLAMAQAVNAQQQATRPEQQEQQQAASKGVPRQGAIPGPQRPMQQPAGAIHQDRMPMGMPRQRGVI
jgi:hypothetical protein